VGDPERFKTIARLTYIAELVSFLSARSGLAASLQTRLAALNALEDISPLDKIALRKGNGEPYAFEGYLTIGEHPPWFSAKSIVTDGPVGGQVFVVDDSHLLFVGIQGDLLRYAAEQDFTAIREYRFDAGNIVKTIVCVVSAGRFERYFAPVMTVPESELHQSGGYVWFSVGGRLTYTRSGIVYGAIPIPADWKATL
jgi:hypothetical protein